MAEFLTQFYSSTELLEKADLFCTEGKIAEGKALLTEAKKIFSPDITSHLEPIEKTILYLESGRDKTVLQKMNPEIRIAVEAILKEIK